jgi:hypothetical protein
MEVQGAAKVVHREIGPRALAVVQPRVGDFPEHEIAAAPSMAGSDQEVRRARRKRGGIDISAPTHHCGVSANRQSGALIRVVVLRDVRSTPAAVFPFNSSAWPPRKPRQATCAPGEGYSEASGGAGRGYALDAGTHSQCAVCVCHVFRDFLASVGARRQRSIPRLPPFAALPAHDFG